MRTIQLSSLSYQEINAICAITMVILALFGRKYMRSIQQNFSRFLITQVTLYSVALVLDAYRDYQDKRGWGKPGLAEALAVAYCFCMLFAAASWCLYTLTRLHPKIKNNYIVYFTAIVPAMVVTAMMIHGMMTGHILSATGKAQFTNGWFWAQNLVMVFYYALTLIVALISAGRKKNANRTIAMHIAAFPIPFLALFACSITFDTNYVSLGITLSFTLFVSVALNHKGRVQKEELSLFSNIMDSLKDQFTSILYVDLDENHAESYTVNEKIIEEAGRTEEDSNYDQIWDRYSTYIVHPDDRDSFRAFVKRDNLGKMLKEKANADIEYRILVDGKTKCVNMRLECWRAKDDIDSTHVVMGFKDITAEKKKELAEAKKNTIISGLVKSFEYVCVCDYSTEEFEEYYASKPFEYFFNVIGVTEGFERFSSIFKHGMDKEKFAEFRESFNKNTILENIENNNSISYDCRINIGSGSKYYNVIALGVPNYPEMVVFGVTDIDNEVRAEIERKERIKEREYNIQLETTISERTAELHEKAKSLNQINEDITELLGNITEARDTESGTHIKRVKGYTKILATHIKDEFPEYGLDDEQIALITSASALHDIGKIMIPDAILRKPGRFTKEEFDVMKTHCEKGCEILKMAPKGWDKRYLDFSMEICKYHHEKWDGNGYPGGLKNEEIPISAQIVSVADCFDALTTKRVYKDAYELEEAFNMIINGECGNFSDKIMSAFRNAKEEFFEQYMSGVIPDTAAPNLATAKALKDVRILLVEDNELTRDITLEILEDEGAIVTTAVNGEEALAIADSGNAIEFDAILMDLTLPDMSGFEVTERIRNLDIARAKYVPIIAVTSSTEKTDMQRAYDEGMSAYMPKPVSVSNLTRILLTSMKSEQKNLNMRLDEAIMRANKDPLTGVKNMTAYTEAVGELTSKIANKEPLEFAIVMCDVNKLKVVNDKFGHDMGDRYIRNCSKIICNTYSHSPVYRIGGDEFAVILTGEDYKNRNELIDDLGQKIAEAAQIDRIEDGRARMAAGMSVYNPYSDFSVASVTKRADESMYTNKRMMEFGGMF